MRLLRERGALLPSTEIEDDAEVGMHYASDSSSGETSTTNERSETSDYASGGSSSRRSSSRCSSDSELEEENARGTKRVHSEIEEDLTCPYAVAAAKFRAAHLKRRERVQTAYVSDETLSWHGSWSMEVLEPSTADAREIISIHDSGSLEILEDLSSAKSRNKLLSWPTNEGLSDMKENVGHEKGWHVSQSLETLEVTASARPGATMETAILLD